VGTYNGGQDDVSDNSATINPVADLLLCCVFCANSCFKYLDG
jgi:hypothetical protein